MKAILYIAIFLFMIPVTRADVPPAVRKKFKQIIRLIKEDKANELAALVVYPLKRVNPLPDIANQKAFIADYKVLIDDAFKKKLLSYNDSIVFEHHGLYGLVGGDFDGDLWIDENGKITAINYSSKREKQLQNELIKTIKKHINPAVNTWDYNILVGKSEKLLVRVDYMGKEKGIRYALWSKGRPTSEKPDLILYKGKDEAKGTQGGWTYTFKNGDWTYVVDDVEMCESDDQCGLFLRLSFKGVEKSSTKLKEIK